MKASTQRETMYIHWHQKHKAQNRHADYVLMWAHNLVLWKICSQCISLIPETKVENIESVLTGLALMILKAGTIITVTANNVKVSIPKSFIISTPLATSTAAYIRNLSFIACPRLENWNPLSPKTKEDNESLPLDTCAVYEKQRLILWWAEDNGGRNRQWWG